MKSFVKFRPKQSRRRQARLISPWCSALERLEERVLLTIPQLANPIASQSAAVFTSFQLTVTQASLATTSTNTFIASAGDTITLSATQADGSALPAWLTFLPVNNKFFGTPTTSDVGTINVKVTATDTDGTATDTFALTVQPNAQPSFTIAADPAAINEDATPQPITVSNFASSISAGTSESGQTVAFNLVGVSNPGLFSAPPAISASGTLTYFPAADANGTSFLTFSLLDNGGTTGGGIDTSISHTFKITVNAVADIVADSLTTTEDTAVTANVITGTNGASADNFEGAPVLTSVTTQGTNGVVTFTAAGSVTYTPKADFNGSDSFTYTVTSGGVTETATVSVTISAAADIVADSLTTNEDMAITANLITGTGGASADNFEGTPLLTSVTQGTNGSVTFTGVGSVTYTPKADFNGSDSFTYTVTSGGVTETATVSITVNAVNDAPTIAAPGAQTTAEDTAKVISGLLSFADVDAGSGNVVVTLSVMSGKLALLPDVTNGLTATQISANGLSSVTITAPLAAINATLANAAGLTYTPNLDSNGSDSLGIKIDDQGNTGGVAQVAMTSAPITVTPVNDAPTFTLAGNPTAVNEDTGLQTVASFATNISVGPANESASQTISNFTVTAGPTTGGLTFLTAPSIDPNTGTLTYQAAANANGTATFTVTLTDSGSNTSPNVNTSASKTFVITVTAVNDAPTIAAPGLQTTPQGTAKVITGVSFADVDAGTSNVTVTFNVVGGTLTVLGNVTSGVTTSQVTGSGTSTVTITAPLAAINATLANAAGLTYTPNATFFGNDPLSITINDLGNTGGAAAITTASVAIFVTPSGGYAIITTETKNVTYTAAGSAKLRAVVVNGVLIVSVNGIGYPFYQKTDKIETLTFNGGSKNDEVDLSGLDPALYTSLVSVKIKGNAGNDRIVGSFADDSIDGGAGNDTLTGGEGNDTLIGNAGTDLLVETATTDDPDLTLNDTSLMGLGTDKLVTIENASLTAADTDSSIDASGFTRGAVTLIGGEGDDTLIGGSKNDAITGRDGDDSLTGGAGNDTMLGGFGEDVLNGGLGNDLLIGGFDDDVIDGGDGRDTVGGGQGGAARGGVGAKDAGDDLSANPIKEINEAFKKLFAFE